MPTGTPSRPRGAEAQDNEPRDPAVPAIGRRAAIVGAGAVALGVVAACGPGGSEGPGGAGGPGSGQSSDLPDGAPGTVLGPVSDVPVGGGAVFVEQQVVVTQATPGQFQGLSTVCPHQGCQVNAVRDGQVVCPCHGSRFGLDGAVIAGPAQSPLARRAVSVQGQNITLA